MRIDELEHLVSKCVRTQAQGDYDALFTCLFGFELFFNMDVDSFGKGRVVMYKTDSLEHIIKSFTSRTNSHLITPFAGVRWAPALEMLSKMPEADGLSVMNESEDWVVFSSIAIRKRLEASGHGI